MKEIIEALRDASARGLIAGTIGLIVLMASLYAIVRLIEIIVEPALPLNGMY